MLKQGILTSIKGALFLERHGRNMNKKPYITIVVLMITAIFAGVGITYATKNIQNEYLSNSGEELKEFSTSKNNIMEEKNGSININESLISSGKNYKIFDITKDYDPEYKYIIYDKNGNIVMENTTITSEPQISYLDDKGILSIQISAGTGLCLTQYYNIIADIFSEVFFSPVISKYGLVVFGDFSCNKNRLIVRDIFDKSKYYQEFELDFSPIANPTDALQHVEFVDEDTLSVIYISSEEYIDKTAILKLK